MGQYKFPAPRGVDRGATLNYPISEKSILDIVNYRSLMVSELII